MSMPIARLRRRFTSVLYEPSVFGLMGIGAVVGLVGSLCCPSGQGGQQFGVTPFSRPFRPFRRFALSLTFRRPVCGPFRSFPCPVFPVFPAFLPALARLDSEKVQLVKNQCQHSYRGQQDNRQLR